MISLGFSLGYTATDQNVIYLDTTTGIVKSCHLTVFDEAWYLQPTRPPAAQLLYNLGLEAKQDFVSISGPVLQPPVSLISPVMVAWPPFADATSAPTLASLSHFCSG
jgi:hypothetical protein